ncbi:hypothetical protein VTN00DRAFT_2775 [Thermoascus crustaceus]|uniref:uncharacterized protein n=1 Tax=Thermoascus crustaceus TaxID=5088 RepID=UPI0037437F80
MVALRVPAVLPVSRACGGWSSISGSVSISSVERRLSRSSVLSRTATRPFHSTPICNSTTSTPRVSYRIAAASSAKGRRFNPEKNAYNFDPELHDALGLVTDTDPAVRRRQRPDSGEDAFFVTKVGGRDLYDSPSGGAVAFGVADGVGGWTESKVDPADFSHGLCSYMAGHALGWDSGPEKLRAKALLQNGYDRVVEDESIFAGGSTASLGVAQRDGRVELANLGDSGSVLLRLAAVHHYSTPQTHDFNTPYQLSIIPPRMRAQAAVFGGTFLEDSPRDAAVSNINMQHGDVLVLATDGVFDNLNNQDILKIVTGRMILAGAWTGTADMGIGVSKHLDALTRPGGLAAPPPSPAAHADAPPSPAERSGEQKPRLTAKTRGHTLQALLALSIAGEAKIASVDFRRDGPFAKEAQRYRPQEWYRGGKVDDICALVVVAVEEGR